MTNDLVLNSETCSNIINMMNSPDKENWTVVEELLNHIDVETNLPYVLMIYKEARTELRRAIFSDKTITKLVQLCSTFNFDGSQQVTYQKIYDEIKNKNVSQESMDYFLQRFAESLKEAMTNWGYSFMKDFSLKLIPKDESSR